MPQERRISVEAEIPMTPDQERRASFLREREEYTSSLERIIAHAKERSASCSPGQSARSMAITPATSSVTTMNESMTSTIIVDCSSPISSTFEDIENEVGENEVGEIEVRLLGNSSQLSKRPASSRGEGVMTKRVAFGRLDSNARRSPRSKKGKNSRYNNVEYAL
jgi:hypothetical protein